MSTITDPIILDSTGQAIKNSIDLLSANINRTASNIPYDSNLTIKGKIDEIDAKTADDIPYSSGVSVKDKIDEALGGATTLLNQQQMSLTETSYLLSAAVNTFRFVIIAISWAGGLPSNELFILNGVIKNSRIYLNGNPTAEYADIIEFTDSTHVKLKATNTNIFINIYGIK